MAASEEAFCWNEWVPGVLSENQVKKLLDEGALKDLEESNIDKSAVDLVLDDQAFRMTKGAVKPFGQDYEHFLRKSSYAEPFFFSEEATLQPRTTYVFRVKLELGPTLISSKRFHGQATGRSSVGRVDVLTRLIVNGMDEYEGFTPSGSHRGINGRLFLEVTPITFPVKVKPGIALSQLRLFLGSPDSARMNATDICITALRNADPNNNGYLSLQVKPEEVGTDRIKTVAFGANMKQQEGAEPNKTLD